MAGTPPLFSSPERNLPRTAFREIIRSLARFFFSFLAGLPFRADVCKYFVAGFSGEGVENSPPSERHLTLTTARRLQSL